MKDKFKIKKWLLFILIIPFLSIPTFANDANPQTPSTNSIINPGLVITLLTAILTILGSGVAAAWISQRLAKSKEELFDKRKKLEGLYKSVYRYTTILFRMNFMWPRVMDGDLSFNQGLDLQINSNTSDEEKQLLPEIDMLINFYFSNFLPTYENFVKKREVLNELYEGFKYTYKVKGPTIDYSKNKKEFVKTLFEVEDASKALLNEVAQYAKTLK
jgi:hypothetical protein